MNWIKDSNGDLRPIAEIEKITLGKHCQLVLRSGNSVPALLNETDVSFMTATIVPHTPAHPTVTAVTLYHDDDEVFTHEEPVIAWAIDPVGLARPIGLRGVLKNRAFERSNVWYFIDVKDGEYYSCDLALTFENFDKAVEYFRENMARLDEQRR